MLTPEEKAAGKVEWDDIPLDCYIDTGGFPEDQLLTTVDKIPQTLGIAACFAFVIGCMLALQIREFHWFLYLSVAGWGAAVGFWLASRIAQSAIFLQRDIDREKRGLKKSVRPVSSWKKWIRRRNG
jgi:hypothetical protein